MDNFKKLCKAAGIYSDHDFVQSIDRITNDIVKSIEEYCWDGNWYVRAFSRCFLSQPYIARVFNRLVGAIVECYQW